MNAKVFVNIFKKEKDDLLETFFSESCYMPLIRELQLNNSKIASLKEIVDLMLTDTLYTLLMGLDGEANIGGVQQTYKIYDENGDLISECGELEAAAYELLKS